MNQTRKIILDTDPGIDDILAIMLAATSPEFDLLGVTTVAGNCPVEQGTSNALCARDALGAANFPVVPGCRRPLTRPLRTQKDVYGYDEDLGLPFDPDWRRRADPRHAVDFLREQVACYPGEITLFPLAPLTNIAAAISLDPTFAPNVREIFLMGGAATVPGNTTAFTEFNFWVDPEAAKIVFESGIPITMIGLDVTGKTALWSEDAATLDRIDTPISRFIRTITRNYHSQNHPCYLYDPLAVAVGLDPALVKQAPCVHVDIETAGEFTSGASVADLQDLYHRAPNARVCLEVDSEAFLGLFWERVIGHPRA